MHSLPQQRLIRMETIAHSGGLEHVMKTERVLLAIARHVCTAHHGVQILKPSLCVRLLQLLPEDANSTGLRSVTLNSTSDDDTDLVSAENEKDQYDEHFPQYMMPSG